MANSSRSAVAAWRRASACASAWPRSTPAASRARAAASGLKVLAVMMASSGSSDGCGSPYSTRGRAALLRELLARPEELLAPAAARELGEAEAGRLFAR